MRVPSMSRPQRWSLGLVLATVLVVVVTAVLGGFREVERFEVTEVAAGEEFEVGPFRLAIHNAVSQIDPDAYVDEGEPLPRRLLLAVDVTVTEDVYQRDFVLADIVRPAGDLGLVDMIDDEPPPANVLGLADGVDVAILNPGITYRLVLVWEQEPDWSRPDEIDVAIGRMFWVEEDPFKLDNQRWGRAREAGHHLTVPVETDDTVPEELLEDL